MEKPEKPEDVWIESENGKHQRLRDDDGHLYTIYKDATWPYGPSRGRIYPPIDEESSFFKIPNIEEIIITYCEMGGYGDMTLHEFIESFK